jgi:hypothetical protein
LAEGTNLYFTTARGNANFATNLAASDTDDLAEGATNLYFTNARARTALSVTAGTGISYDNTTGVFNLAAIPNASLTNSSITINSQAVSLGGTVTLTTTNIAEGTNLYYTSIRDTANFESNFATKDTDDLPEGTNNLYWTTARGNTNFTTNLAASTTTNLAEGTNLYYTQARFDTAFSNKSTTNLAEGTNLYYTQARFNSALSAKTTTDLAEGSNLYYTDARARLALASSATGLTYANNSGVFSLTAGYAIPTTVKLGEYDIAYNRSIVSAAVTGTTTKTLSLTQQDANVVTATWTDLGITTINGTANQIAATTVGNTTTLAFTNDVTMPNNLVVSGNLTINGTATYVNTESISSKDPLFEVANTNNTTDAVDIGYYGRYYDSVQERVEFTGLFRDASDAGKFKIFNGLVDEPTNVVNTTGTGYTVATLVANVDGNLNGTANAANILSTARTISATGDAAWSVSFDGSANATAALTLANTGVTATTYGTSTAVPTIAVDSKGRITSASNTNITFPVTTVNGFAGTVVLTTSDVAEGTNQYFTSARAQAAISGTAPISVASGVVSITESSTIANGFLSSTNFNVFNNKQAAITGAATTITSADLTASRALISNASGKVATSATTDTELGYVSGVTSAIQTQLNGKLNLTGGTLTGGLSGTTGTFSGILTTPQVKAATSAGLSINANSGTQVADFGAGGGANITFFGGLSGTSATFSGASSAKSLTVNETSANSYGILSLKGTSRGGEIDFFDGATIGASIYGGTGADKSLYFTTNGGSSVRLTITSAGAATFSSSSSIIANGQGIRVYSTDSQAADLGGGISLGGYYVGTSTIADFANIKAGKDNSTSGNYSGYLAFSTNNQATGNVERMRITSGGKVNITGGSDDYTMNVVNSRSAGYGMYIQAGNGSTYTAIEAFNYNASTNIFRLTGAGVLYAQNTTIQAISDVRTKENIVDSKDGLDIINALRPVRFDFKEGFGFERKNQLGFIAQEVEKVFPDIVDEWKFKPEDEITYKTVGPSGLIPVLVKAIQELEARIKELEAK